MLVASPTPRLRNSWLRWSRSRRVCQYRINTSQKCRLKKSPLRVDANAPTGRWRQPDNRCSMAPGPPSGKIGMVVLREIVMIHDLRRQGLGIAAIARQTGLDRKTVRKHLGQGLQAAASSRCTRLAAPTEAKEPPSQTRRKPSRRCSSTRTAGRSGAVPSRGAPPGTRYPAVSPRTSRATRRARVLPVLTATQQRVSRFAPLGLCLRFQGSYQCRCSSLQSDRSLE